MDKVAVLMSTFNGAKYLSIQIDSILAQEDVCVDLYIRDDGSSDNTVEIINQYASKDKRVHFVPGEPLGVGRSFMTLLMMDIQADYYSFSDQDDYWYPNKLKAAVEKLNSESNKMALYCCNQNCVDADGNFLYTRFPLDYQIPSLIQSVFRNDLAGCTMLMSGVLRKVVLEKMPPLDFLNFEIHDAWILCVTNIVGKVIFDPNPFMDFRRHGNTYSDETVSSNRKKSMIIIYKERFLRLKKRNFQRRNTVSKTASYLVDFYGQKISVSDKNDLKLVYRYSGSLMKKMKLLVNKRFQDSIKNDRIAFYFKVLTNRL